MSFPRTNHRAAFTLVEIVLALAIVATGIIGIIGLIPLGLDASRKSASHTVVAVILEDVHDRLRGREFADTPEEHPVDFYYDDQGLFIPDQADEEQLFLRNYVARVRIANLHSQQVPDGTKDLKAVRIELYSPIHPATGEPMGRIDPETGLPRAQSTVSYYLTPLTGPDWKEIDPAYKPRIEY